MKLIVHYDISLVLSPAGTVANCSNLILSVEARGCYCCRVFRCGSFTMPLPEMIS